MPSCESAVTISRTKIPKFFFASLRSAPRTYKIIYVKNGGGKIAYFFHETISESSWWDQKYFSFIKYVLYLLFFALNLSYIVLFFKPKSPIFPIFWLQKYVGALSLISIEKQKLLLSCISAWIFTLPNLILTILFFLSVSIAWMIQLMMILMKICHVVRYVIGNKKTYLV